MFDTRLIRVSTVPTAGFMTRTRKRELKRGFKRSFRRGLRT